MIPVYIKQHLSEGQGEDLLVAHGSELIYKVDRGLRYHFQCLHQGGKYDHNYACEYAYNHYE